MVSGLPQMPFKSVWLKYLWKERRLAVLKQAFRMFGYHRTPFKSLLSNILRVMEEFHAGFTFPVVASLALRHADLIGLIKEFNQEIALHGYKHLNYSYLSADEQRKDIENGLQAFRDLEISVRGFRAPYNICPDMTAKILEDFGFLWEGSLGFRKDYCELRSFFRVKMDDHDSSFVCIPISRWSDDRMIDGYGLNSAQMVKVLKNALRETFEKRGVIMFDLHPVRIGQQKYIDVLNQILAYGEKMDGWFPTVTEAVEYWLKHRRWKGGAKFCCLLTGDIDSFTFSEYLTRLF